MSFNAVEAARLAYDCYCSSCNNKEPVPVILESVHVTRRRQGDLEIKPPDKVESTSLPSWDKLDKDGKKRWVDIALSVVTYYTGATLLTQ